MKFPEIQDVDVTIYNKTIEFLINLTSMRLKLKVTSDFNSHCARNN